MTGDVFQRAVFNIFFPRHTVEVCSTTSETARFFPSYFQILPTCSSSGSDFSEKLVDNPEPFLWHNDHIGSNIHSA